MDSPAADPPPPKAAPPLEEADIGGFVPRKVFYSPLKALCFRGRGPRVDTLPQA